MKMVERQQNDNGASPNFPLLADPGHSVIDRYGQLNPERFQHSSNPDPAGYIVPHPAVFVINQQGIVTWKFTNTDASIRASNEQILEALTELQEK